MKNGTFNVYPKAALDAATAALAREARTMPGWWTAADEVDRNAARKGCQEPERDCIECRVEQCPEARRMCRVCAEWTSDGGEVGKCPVKNDFMCRDETCGKWRARG
jgi:hypothetical protein